MQTWTKTISMAMLVALAGCGGPSGSTSIEITEAWSPDTPPGTTVAAGYMTIRNGTAVDDVVVAMESPVAETIEVHTMTMEEGMMRMRKLEALEVPAGKTVALEPAQLHLMLVGLKQPLVAGTRYPLSLTFKAGGKVSVDVDVRGSDAAADDHSGHQH